jgi:hypothetical protein
MPEIDNLGSVIGGYRGISQCGVREKRRKRKSNKEERRCYRER